MKYIFEVYGRFFLAGIMISMLLPFLFLGKDAQGNTGMLKLFGTAWKQGYDDSFPETGFSCYEMEAAKEIPSLQYEYHDMIYAEEEVLLTSLLGLKGQEEQQMSLRVLEITDRLGVDKSTCYDANTGKICFPREGIYRLEIAVKDSSCKKYTCAMNVPVNKRG